MFRYLVFFWSANDVAAGDCAARLLRSALDTDSSWVTAVSVPGCIILWTDGSSASANTALAMRGTQGAILGKLFRRNGSSAAIGHVNELDETECKRIVETQGEHLATHFWGRYVAFWLNPENATANAVRDPTGTLPCFQTRASRVQIFCSSIEDCVSLRVIPFTVNWPYLYARVPAAVLQSSETGLEQVTALYPGQRIEIAGDRKSSSWIWDPRKIALENPIEDATRARDTLREATQVAVSSWASSYRRILLRLSGGLDSSIVAACLDAAPARPDFEGILHYSRGADSDEREYARLAAQSAGCSLIECKREEAVRLQDALQMIRTPVPGTCVPYTQNGRLEPDVATSRHADGIFTGSGGDQVFYQSRARLSVVDYFLRHRWKPGLLPVAHSAALIEQRSVWELIGDARSYRRKGVSEQLRSESGNFRHLVSAEIIEAASQTRRFDHPWLDPLGNLGPGKLWHIATLCSPADYYDLFGRLGDPEYVHPLWSQIVVEACLRTPTYILTQSGLDRALARQAFLDVLPRSIALRRTKGGLEEHLKEVLRRNTSFVREILMDGQLVARGILNRENLDIALSGRPSRLGSSTIEVYDYLSLELWLLSWGNLPRAVAA